MLQQFGHNPRGFHAGQPGIVQFGDAVQVWATRQPTPYVLVGEAADVFVAEPELIVEAVERNRYLVIADQRSEDMRQWLIGHDG